MDCTVVYCGMVIKITRMNNCAVQVADRGRSWPEIKKALAKARKKKQIKDSPVVYCGTVIKISRMNSNTTQSAPWTYHRRPWLRGPNGASVAPIRCPWPQRGVRGLHGLLWCVRDACVPPTYGPMPC